MSKQAHESQTEYSVDGNDQEEEKQGQEASKKCLFVYLLFFFHEQASHAQNADQQTLHEIIHTENYMTWENYQFFTREAAVLLESFLDNLPDYSINIPIYLFTYLFLDDVALASLESCFHSPVARKVQLCRSLGVYSGRCIPHQQPQQVDWGATWHEFHHDAGFTRTPSPVIY